MELKEIYSKMSDKELMERLENSDTYFDDAKEKFHLIRKEILSMTHMEYIHFCKTELKLNDSDIEKDCSKNPIPDPDGGHLAIEAVRLPGGRSLRFFLCIPR